MVSLGTLQIGRNCLASIRFRVLIINVRRKLEGYLWNLNHESKMRWHTNPKRERDLGLCASLTPRVGRQSN